MLDAAAVTILKTTDLTLPAKHPKGLKGNAIPLQARIIKIANDFSSQIDREGASIPETLIFIKDRSGIQYDPELVDLLTHLFSSNPKVY